ncbi:MAG: peptidyl-prolyl cis-trans isomerase [Candidatus Omnitrophica bacterium]|nr:peptidyl-prolyl cis-trans isomerase [Candidatus Omnitrophota bacterium]
MLFKNLRKHTKTIMWLIAIFIVPAFVIWNIGSAVKNRRSGFAGEIFKKKVAFKDYILAQRAARNEALMQFGNEFEKSINLEEQAWTRLILVNEAKKRKLKIENKELINHIKNLPLLKNANLNPENYSYIIGQFFHQNPEEFENSIRDSLLIAKLMEALTAEISVSESEVKQVFVKETESATVSYILIEPKKYTEEVLLDNEEAIKKFFEANKDAFKKPEQVDVEYIEIKFEGFKDKIEITEEKIEKYYENNKEKFKIIAEESKEPQSTIANYQPLSEVKDNIRERLMEKQMDELAYELARQMMSKLYTQTDMNTVAGEFGLKSKKTGPFSMLEEIPNVGISFPFLKSAFSLSIGEVSEIIKTPTAFYIIKPVKKIKPYIPEYPDVAEKVKDKYRLSKASELAEQKSQVILGTLNTLIKDNKLPFESAATELGFELKKAEKFTRSSYINELGFAKDLTETAFSLKPQEISGVINTFCGLCIMRLEEIIPAKDEDFEKDREKYYSKVLLEKRNQFLNAWFENIQQQANLKIYKQKN